METALRHFEEHREKDGPRAEESHPQRKYAEAVKKLRGKEKMIELVILGEPMGKQRPKFNRYTGTAYTPSKTINYETLVKHEYMSKYGKMAFDDDSCIQAWIKAYFRMPKTDFSKHGLSKSGRKKAERMFKCNAKADADNIAKACLDALNGVAYPDDRQITSLIVSKHWAEEPKVVITLAGDLFCDHDPKLKPGD